LRNALLVALALWGIHWAWYWLAERIMAQSPETKLSDALEASGALFSGLAFLAAVCTLWVQREDLKLQRQELKDTREELKGQKEQMKLQNATYVRQNFENSFFSLLKLHKDYSSDLNAIGTNGLSRMRNIFERIITTNKWGDERARRSINRVHVSFIDIYDEHADSIECGEICHVLRLWNSVMRYIHDATHLSYDEKTFYFDVFMSQVSQYECALMALHVSGKNGSEIMEQEIEKRGLFAGFQLDMLEDDIKKYFKDSAFGLTEFPPLTPPPPLPRPSDTPGPQARP